MLVEHTTVLVPGAPWPKFKTSTRAQNREERNEKAKAYRIAQAGKPKGARGPAAVITQTAQILGWVAAHPGLTGSEIAIGMGLCCHQINRTLGYAAEREKLKYEWVTAKSGRPAKAYYTWDTEYI